MKPQDELDYLKHFIKLTPEQAIKRDMLTDFQSNRNKILLLDSDSIAYNVANFWIKNDEGIDLEEMYEDFHSQVRSIVNEMEQEVNIIDIYYYFTTCKNNFRYELCTDYKATREETPVKKLARALIAYTMQSLKDQGLYVDHSDTLEADDLISIYVKTYGHLDVVTCSIDKDLKQIHGAHFDYYKKKTDLTDEYGEPIRVFKGFTYTTPSESIDMFLKQMIEGDKSDNVRGVDGFGKVGAAKLLDGKSNYGKLLAVARAYREYATRDDMNENMDFCLTTKKKYEKHKGEKWWYNNMDRLRLNVKLMRL